MAALSDSTIVNLANAVKCDAVKYISESQEYAEFMYGMFDKFLTEKVGPMDPDLKGEIMCLLMDKIYLI